MIFIQRSASLVLVIAIAHCAAIRLRAADIQWSGSASTDWNNPANWVGGALPAAGNNAHLDVSDDTTDIDSFDDPGFNTTIQQLYVGENNPNATLTQSSGTLNLNGAQAWLKVGANGGSSGIYNLQGTGVLSLTNDVFGIGEHGVGSFNLSNSAQATAPRVALGRYADGRGTVFQSGTSTLTVNGAGNDGNGTPNYALAIGAQSTALSSYSITGGTLNVTGGDLLIGMTSSSNGRMTLAGTGVVSAGHEVHVGESGTGTLVVNGGQFTSAGQMIIGNANGASGTVTQSGGTVSVTNGSPLVLGNQGGGVGGYTLAAGTLNAGGRILVGEDGQAMFTQTGGTNTITQDLSVGDHLGFSTAANPDSYTLSAGTLSAAALQIGAQGFAVFGQSGGSVSATTEGIGVGGRGTFNQTGGSQTAGNIVLGGQATGNGTYNLSAGTLIADSVSGGPGASSFDFNGGVLQPSASNAAFFQYVTGAVVQSGGAILNTNGNNVTIAENLTHDPDLGTTADGGLIKNGAGMLTLTGSNSYSGRTTVNAGILEIDTAPMLVGVNALLVNGGTLRLKVTSGTATIGAGVTATVNSGATLELAGSVSALSAGANRVDIMNNSQVAGGGLLVSGTNQQVGNIDGSGNVTVNAGASLTANHIIQNALLIGGAAGNPATVTIDASDASGAPLLASPASRFSSDPNFGGLALATSLAPCNSFEAGDMSSASLSTAMTDSADLAVLAMEKSVGRDNPAPVPEPSTLLLALLATLGVAGAQHARKRSWGTRI